MNSDKKDSPFLLIISVLLLAFVFATAGTSPYLNSDIFFGISYLIMLIVCFGMIIWVIKSIISDTSEDDKEEKRRDEL